ncbi:MAG: DEAD/DEAH box helicase [Bacteroidia bacterium]
MNSYEIHKSIVEDYKSYIHSFINIRDEHIKKEVKKAIDSDKLLPEALVHFNPAYETGATIDELVKGGVLHSDLQYAFKNFSLYKHQVEAIKKGKNRESFIVTSGTGSGKSLTYIGTIFDHILNNPELQGIQAVIVYPMNALINSQEDAIKEYAKNYETQTQKVFPINVRKYTGQENQQLRKEIKDNPPHVILTNYMMLELILTRSDDAIVADSMYKNLNYLVLDELHTYRGRQGADVAFLIRRLKARCANRSVICIGTSATMTTEGSMENQKSETARVASEIFGSHFDKDQVIGETLRCMLGETPINLAMLKNEIVENKRILKEIDIRESELARWMEQNIGIEKKDGVYVRKSPLNLKDISALLAEKSSESPDACNKSIISLLEDSSRVNISISKERPLRSYLPHKFHQFVAQTGSVYVTLENQKERKITLEAKSKTSEDEGKLPFFQVVFSQSSGYEFICVRWNTADNKLESRDFFDSGDEDDEEYSSELGYIFLEKPDDLIWNEAEDLAYLPPSWFNIRNNERIIKKDYKKKIPRPIWFSPNGNVSDFDEQGYTKGFYIPYPLPFDPSSKLTFGAGRFRESNKLSRLSTEGRSTATTVLSYLTIKNLHKEKIPLNEQKLLCFTDVRQDAALQSGHFNDFVKVGQLRSAVYQALKNNGELNYENIDSEVFNALKIEQEEYAKAPSLPGTFQYKENEKALKGYLYYRIITDLRRGWRVILPNLEQVALLKIEYAGLAQESLNSIWDSIPEFRVLNQNERITILHNLLEFFRTSYALSFDFFNQPDQKKKLFRDNLKDSWSLDEDEDIRIPDYMALSKVQFVSGRVQAFPVGARSAFGWFIKNELVKKDLRPKNDAVDDLIEKILDALVKLGKLRKYENLAPETLYQLNGVCIRWMLGDGENVWEDKVRIRKHTGEKAKPNIFFQQYYKQDFQFIKQLNAKDHTGQVKGELREQYEDEFKKGKISALYCSPTMELGVDISDLNVVQMRNVPPTPSNYIQRSGRAGRSGQSALVITFCGSYSAHDKHYFDHRNDMVMGKVTPPKLNLTLEELLLTHLNAMFLAKADIEGLNESIRLIVVEDALESKLLLKDDVSSRLQLQENVISEIATSFSLALGEIKEELEKNTTWFTKDWIYRNLKNAGIRFDYSLNRWRDMYRKAKEQLNRATQKLNDPTIPMRDKIEPEREMKYANRQLELLRNDSSKTPGKNQLSEFYPYRYLAAEGFLPGYNFTRLPVRAFIPSDDSGDFISRPRFIALREFGPNTIIYHSGKKYQVNQMEWLASAEPLMPAKVAKSSGYILYGSDYNNSVCPISNEDLSINAARLDISNLLKMQEVRTRPRSRITCEEEERTRLGFKIDTYINLQGKTDRIHQVQVNVDGQPYLHVRYFPAAQLVQVNSSGKKDKESGFLIGKKTGFWKKQKDLQNRKPDSEEIVNVKLYTTDTADALYIEPTKNLNLSEAGITTLMYALKRGIEQTFQVEPSELGVQLMGKPEQPNMMIYEASEGSLGVLSRIVHELDLFKKVVDEAWEICHFNLSEEKQKEFGAASYSDLLSYFNQRDHKIIDRYLIKDCLEQLKSEKYELKKNNYFKTYDEQFEQLKTMIDPSSSTEEKFIKYLYKNNLRLPDQAQVPFRDCSTIPDFIYLNGVQVCVFCDGSHHDDEKVKRFDEGKRECMKNKGYEVVIWHYSQALEEFVKQYPHIFNKVR